MAQYQATTHQQITIDRSKLKKKKKIHQRRERRLEAGVTSRSQFTSGFLRSGRLGAAAGEEAGFNGGLRPGRLGAATGEEAGGKRHCIRLLLGEAALRWNGTAAPRRGVAAVSSSSVFASSGAGRRIQ
ncbi:unnamed protein product [Urochloa humidicola]